MSLTSVVRLASRTQRTAVLGWRLDRGVQASCNRGFQTTPERPAVNVIPDSNLRDIEETRGSLYKLIWKRKFTWLIIFGGIGALIFELVHPDKENRSKQLMKDWKSGGSYNKPERGIKKDPPEQSS